jgi:hypothetical protein
MVLLAYVACMGQVANQAIQLCLQDCVLLRLLLPAHHAPVPVTVSVLAPPSVATPAAPTGHRLSLPGGRGGVATSDGSTLLAQLVRALQYNCRAPHWHVDVQAASEAALDQILDQL